MDETTNAIPGGLHTHGVYGDYGRRDDGCVQNQINQLADQVSANGIREAVNSVGNNVVNGTASVKDTVNGVNHNVTTGNYTTLTGLNDLGRDINHTISHQGFDFINAINSSNIATLTGFNNTNATMATGFNQSFLQNKDISSQMAAGFCDVRTEMSSQHCAIKELVREENTKTRDLITANQILDLQRQLNDVKSDNSNLKQTRQILDSLLTCCPKTCPSSGNGNGNGND